MAKVNKLLSFDSGLILWLKIDTENGTISTKIPACTSEWTDAIDDTSPNVEEFLMAIYSDNIVQQMVKETEEPYKKWWFDSILLISDHDKSRSVNQIFAKSRFFGSKEIFNYFGRTNPNDVEIKTSAMYEAKDEPVFLNARKENICDFEWEWTTVEFMALIEVLFYDFKCNTPSIEEIRDKSHCKIFVEESK